MYQQYNKFLENGYLLSLLTRTKYTGTLYKNDYIRFRFITKIFFESLRSLRARTLPSIADKDHWEC